MNEINIDINALKEKYKNNDVYLVATYNDDKQFYVDMNGEMIPLIDGISEDIFLKTLLSCKDSNFNNNEIMCDKKMLNNGKLVGVTVFKYYPSNLEGRERFFHLLEESQEQNGGRRTRKYKKYGSHKGHRAHKSHKLHKHVGGSTRKNRKNNKNSNSNMTTQEFQREITQVFLTNLLMVKLFHWKTTSYAAHKATDDLYTKLNANFDAFIEILLGKTESRINLMSVKTLPLKDFTSQEEFKKEIIAFKEYLFNLNENKVMLQMQNTDLFNIRDTIVGDLNQLLYLLTFK